jgi:radical SAM protein with 4Fe4S-binding SPASM domain
MCWFYGESGVGDTHRGEELSTDDVFRVIDQASKFKSAMYLGGAEPLLRRDFFEILDYIKARGLFVSFTTNGTLLDAGKIETLVSLGVDHVAFSVDGVEEVHDDIRGKGAYKRVVLAISELSKCKRRRGSKKPSVAINMTVSENLATRLKDTIGAVVDATDDGVDSYRIHQLWFITQQELLAHQAATRQFLGCSSPGAASHLIPTSQLLDATPLAEEILSLKSWSKVRSFPYLTHDGILKYYAEGGKIDQRCIAPFFGVVIKPNGDVKFCPDEWIDDYILGNVRNDSLEAIWNNASARRFRSALFRQKCFPGCKRCSFMYSVRHP